MDWSHQLSGGRDIFTRGHIKKKRERTLGKVSASEMDKQSWETMVKEAGEPKTKVEGLKRIKQQC